MVHVPGISGDTPATRSSSDALDWRLGVSMFQCCCRCCVYDASSVCWIVRRRRRRRRGRQHRPGSGNHRPTAQPQQLTFRTSNPLPSSVTHIPHNHSGRHAHPGTITPHANIHTHTHALDAHEPADRSAVPLHRTTHRTRSECGSDRAAVPVSPERCWGPNQSCPSAVRGCPHMRTRTPPASSDHTRTRNTEQSTRTHSNARTRPRPGQRNGKNNRGVVVVVPWPTRRRDVAFRDDGRIRVDTARVRVSDSELYRGCTSHTY